jgi:hypothetical protein
MKQTGILSFLFFSLVIITSSTNGQGRREIQDSLMQFQDSRNGYILPVSGHIRILVVFAEVIYDTGTDPCPPGGTKEWPAGNLPQWKDLLFDPYPSQNPNGKVSAFFHEASFGGYQVTGDYLINPDNPEKPVQIKFSERISTSKILEKASEFSAFKTQNSFSVQDFDLWTLTHTGHEKHTPSRDNPLRYDHVMIIIRNSNYPSNLSGWTAARSAGRLFGYENNTYSFFCTYGHFPFHILLHEYSHMLFGGNNFHAGGSHSKKAGAGYFISLQGGWGMMGAAGKAFLTANAWERRRLGWKPVEKNFYISCLDSSGTLNISSDLDATNTKDQGVYLLRDFQTTGDALRIRIPHLPDDVFPQWLWIENHQTKRNNNSEFDVFQYETQPCVEKALPGLYLYMQIDKEEMSGKKIFSGHADYLRFMPANGMYDFVFGDTMVRNTCVNDLKYYPYIFLSRLQNPFSGNHELEAVCNTAIIQKDRLTPDDYVPPVIRKTTGGYVANLPNNGTADLPLRMGGKTKAGIGTNPSTAPMITNVSSGNELFGTKRPNNRVVYLNGISLEILPDPSPVDGGIYVRVRFDDYMISQHMRWCADTIVLPSGTVNAPRVLSVQNRVKLHIDRGLTPTKMINPENISNQLVFTNPTTFIIKDNAVLHLYPGSELLIDNGSDVIVSHTGKIIMEKGSKITVRRNSKLTVKNPESIIRHKRTKIRMR